MATNWREIAARGQTMVESIASGRSWLLCFRKNDDERGAWDGEYWPIGCANLKHVVQYAREIFKHRKGRRVFIQLVTGGSIGCRHVQSRGSMIL